MGARVYLSLYHISICSFFSERHWMQPNSWPVFLKSPIRADQRHSNRPLNLEISGGAPRTWKTRINAPLSICRGLASVLDSVLYIRVAPTYVGILLMSTPAPAATLMTHGHNPLLKLLVEQRSRSTRLSTSSSCSIGVGLQKSSHLSSDIRASMTDPSIFLDTYQLS